MKLFSRHPWRPTFVFAVIGVVVGVQACCAEVAVLANRTGEPIALEVFLDQRPGQTLKLAADESRSLLASSGARVLLTQPDGALQEFPLAPNRAYFVGLNRADGLRELHEIGLGQSPAEAWQPNAVPILELPEANVISVKILVDDDEVRRRRAWEPTIRQRIDKVSAALEAHCGMKLRIVAIEEWDSDDLQRDFFQSLSEFEREVLPAPADVAIGFSSQYDIARGRVHLGGTRKPLHSHILVKERSPSVQEPERVELLAHELGHYLGAAHSPEPTSVMRPVLGQGVQRVAGAKLQYDPPNALLMSMLAEEMRRRGIRDVSALSPETRRGMREVYAALNPALPDDPAAELYVQLMGAAGAEPLIEDTQKVLQQIVRVAQLKKTLVEQAKSGKPARKDAVDPTGDQLLELYVRQAALAAKQVRRENAPRAFLLALGIAFDDADSLRKLPVAGSVIPRIEPQQQRLTRLAALAALEQPAMHERADLAKHFFVSAHLVALVGSEAARSAGLVKETLDSRGGTGFSFADMAANRAGIAFAHAVLNERLSLDDVSRTFAVDSFMPSVDDLREGLQSSEFVQAYGGVDDDRLSAELSRIETRILSLPAYRASPAGKH